MVDLNLTALGDHYLKAFPNSTPLQRASFLANTLIATSHDPARALAQDALRISLNRRNNPMPQNPLAHLAMNRNRMARDENMDPRGGFSPATIDRRPSRDQNPTNLSDPGNYTASIDQEEEESSNRDCDTLLQFVSMCLSALQGEERDKFVGGLQDFLTAPTSGMDRAVTATRRARGYRRPAQDSAVQAINRKGFLSRFPDAANISLSANGRR